LPPLSLYVHFPWCLKKCPYCDFNSHEYRGNGQFPETAYLDALCADLEAALPLIWGRRIYTIFIGGGTPSLMSAAGVDRLLSDIRARLPLDAHAEITLEANPGTFETEKFAQFRQSGINRLSIGIQSFNDAHLGALGRVHNATQARHAVEIAHHTFGNFNLDLMFGLPNQSITALCTDIDTAIACAPPHLSLYQLTIEPNTWFARYPPALPHDDATATMQDEIRGRTHASGYTHYEVSAYARPGHHARHNLNYWQFGDYLGIGAGAHSKLSFSDRIIRQIRHKHPAAYIRQCQAGTPVQEEQTLDAKTLSFEFMLCALRLPAGFAVADFTGRTGLPISAIEAPLLQAESRQLITRNHQTIAPTPLGQRFLSDLQALFL